ncbi:MAG: hypothetical protein U0228_10685 [Myxococcaceae bacterium]
MSIHSSMELFAHVRSAYVGRWLARLDELRQAGELVAIEPPLLGGGGAPVLNERGGFPYRADLLARTASGEPQQVSCVFPQVEVFAPVRFNHDGSLPLRVFPFFWTAAGVRAFGADAGQLRRHIAEWAARWFGLVDPRAVEAIEEADLHGVIHRVQYVEAECTADCIAVEVDLGSSHVEALMTLLDAIKVCGASEVRVGDPTLTAG